MFRTRDLDLALLKHDIKEAEKPLDHDGRIANHKKYEPPFPGPANIDLETRKANRAAYEKWFKEFNEVMRTEHARVKSRTLLYSIRAHARGKVHMHTTKRAFHRYGLKAQEVFTYEDQEKWIGEQWKTYQRPQSEVEAA